MMETWVASLIWIITICFFGLVCFRLGYILEKRKQQKEKR